MIRISLPFVNSDIKGLPGFSVEFHIDAAGRITEAVFNQPNGVFHAKHK